MAMIALNSSLVPVDDLSSLQLVEAEDDSEGKKSLFDRAVDKAAKTATKWAAKKAVRIALVAGAVALAPFTLPGWALTALALGAAAAVGLFFTAKPAYGGQALPPATNPFATLDTGTLIGLFPRCLRPLFPAVPQVLRRTPARSLLMSSMLP